MTRFERVLTLRWFRRKPKPLNLRLLALHMAQAGTLSVLR